MLNPIEKLKRSILHLNRSLHHWIVEWTKKISPHWVVWLSKSRTNQKARMCNIHDKVNVKPTCLASTRWPQQSQWPCNYNGNSRLCPYTARKWFFLNMHIDFQDLCQYFYILYGFPELCIWIDNKSRGYDITSHTTLSYHFIHWFCLRTSVSAWWLGGVRKTFFGSFPVINRIIIWFGAVMISKNFGC